ncbi:hypothetical protein SOVF_149680, partial [Spinacia oleracea]
MAVVEYSADEDMEETDVKDLNLKQSLESSTSQISQLALSNSATGKSSLNSTVGSDTANAGVDIDKKIRALKKKVCDAVTGAKQYTFEGHEPPVYSVCPHHKESIQ